jgi:hypothetical protein
VFGHGSARLFETDAVLLAVHGRDGGLDFGPAVRSNATGVDVPK